jgi:CRISPR-associated protein Csb2
LYRISCIEQAGIPLEPIADLEVQTAPWLGVSGRSFKRPRQLEKLPSCHVRLYFKKPVAGPLALGAGRHRGLGIMANGGS